MQAQDPWDFLQKLASTDNFDARVRGKIKLDGGKEPLSEAQERCAVISLASSGKSKSVLFDLPFPAPLDISPVVTQLLLAEFLRRTQFQGRAKDAPRPSRIFWVSRTTRPREALEGVALNRVPLSQVFPVFFLSSDDKLKLAPSSKKLGGDSTLSEKPWLVHVTSVEKLLELSVKERPTTVIVDDCTGDLEWPEDPLLKKFSASKGTQLLIFSSRPKDALLKMARSHGFVMWAWDSPTFLDGFSFGPGTILKRINEAKPAVHLVNIDHPTLDRRLKSTWEGLIQLTRLLEGSNHDERAILQRIYRLFHYVSRLPVPLDYYEEESKHYFRLPRLRDLREGISAYLDKVNSIATEFQVLAKVIALELEEIIELLAKKNPKWEALADLVASRKVLKYDIQLPNTGLCTMFDFALRAYRGIELDDQKYSAHVTAIKDSAHFLERNPIRVFPGALSRWESIYLRCHADAEALYFFAYDFEKRRLLRQIEKAERSFTGDEAKAKQKTVLDQFSKGAFTGVEYEQPKDPDTAIRPLEHGRTEFVPAERAPSTGAVQKPEDMSLVKIDTEHEIVALLDDKTRSSVDSDEDRLGNPLNSVTPQTINPVTVHFDDGSQVTVDADGLAYVWMQTEEKVEIPL